MLIREIMTTLLVSCFNKVDYNKTRMKWHKILVSDIMALSKGLKSDQVWLNWVVNKQQMQTNYTKTIYSKSKEERSESSESHNLESLSAETEKIIAGNCVMLMESKPWTTYWFSQGQKKEHLNRMREIQFRI